VVHFSLAKYKAWRVSKKYKDRGLYSEYYTIEEFRQNFTNHLNTYFLNEINEHDFLSTHIDTPSLGLKGIKKDNLTENPRIVQSNLQNSRFLKEKEFEINKLFNSIKEKDISIVEEKKTENTSKKDKNTEIGDSLKGIEDITSTINKKSNLFRNFLEDREINFLEKDKELVKSYASSKNIPMDEVTFFNIGNLNEAKSMFGGGSFGTSPSYQLNGSEKEIEKYKMINKLILKINHFNQWKEYFKEIDTKHFIHLAVSNNGTTFDEDVDITLFIRKDQLVKKNDFPLPDTGILETATELLEGIYKIKQTYNIEEYVNSSDVNHYDLPNISLPGLGYQKSLEDLKNQFKDNIEDLFVYDYYQNDEFDIISFNIPYIKQHTSIGFPTSLVFRSKVKEIMFEVNSKHTPEVITGTLEIETIN